MFIIFRSKCFCAKQNSHKVTLFLLNGSEIVLPVSAFLLASFVHPDLCFLVSHTNFYTVTESTDLHIVTKGTALLLRKWPALHTVTKAQICTLDSACRPSGKNKLGIRQPLQQNQILPYTQKTNDFQLNIACHLWL